MRLSVTVMENKSKSKWRLLLCKLLEPFHHLEYDPQSCKVLSFKTKNTKHDHEDRVCESQSSRLLEFFFSEKTS